MFYNTKLLYTPPLEPYELNERALVIDTETVGSGTSVEIVEIALADADGRLLFESLVKPVFNPLPPPSKHHRFERGEFSAAPVWTEAWPRISSLIEGRLLVAYNAAFDRRALAATCSRYRLDSPERGWRCAMQLVKSVVGTRKNLTLDAACAHFGVEGGSHRAARDVAAACRLLKAVLARPRP
ncbi:MAG TPA: 3'-5' exonuclease [Pyrinomonadaceae bacterium]|nr:3'-5' exonuclease [Pyrinomonadaceae bacterium]